PIRHNYSFSFFLRLHMPFTHHFPYSTLFRSYSMLTSKLSAYWGFSPGLERVTVSVFSLTVSSGIKAPNPGRPMLVEELARVTSPDRKSTRLNASHVEISYAVFCLK